MPYVHTPKRSPSNASGFANVGNSVTQNYGITQRRGAALRSGGAPRAGLASIPNVQQNAPAPPTSQGRGAPERWEADAMQFVQTAAMAPAHTVERPLAIANTALRGALGTPQGQPGPLDDVLNWLGSIGFGVEDEHGERNIGRVLGAVGEGIMRIGDAPIAALNARDARVLAKYWDAPDDQEIEEFFDYKKDGPPILGIFGIGGNNMTVGDLRQQLKDRGFWEEVDYSDFSVSELSDDDVRRKIEENPFGFGDARVNESAIVDIAARIGLDPFNILFGAGAIGKAGQLARWATRPINTAARAGGSKLRSAWGTGYMQDMASLGVRVPRLPNPARAAQQIIAGNMSEATLKGLGRALAVPRALLLPGTGSLPRRYARGALRTELGLLGVEYGSGTARNVADAVLGEDNIVSGFMETIHDTSQAFLEDKPMSENVTFMIAAAFGMPAIPLLREDFQAASRGTRAKLGDPDLVLWADRYGIDESQTPVRKDITGAKRGKAKQENLINRLGGEKGFRELLWHIDMRLAFKRLAEYEPLIKHFESFDEAMARSRAVGHVIAREARRMREEGKIGARDRLNEFEDWGRSHSRTIIDKDGKIVRDVAERVDFELSPEALIDQWLKYREVTQALERRFTPVGEAITGRARRLTQEDLRAVKAAVNAMTEDGKVNAQHLRDLMHDYPATFEDASIPQGEREFWQSIMALGTNDSLYGGGKIDAAVVQRHIDNLLDDAPPARELFHEAAAAERDAPVDPSRRRSGPVTNGRLRKIYSIKKLREMRTNKNGLLRAAQSEIDDGVLRLEKKWTKKGNLRIQRTRVKSPTKPEASPMGGIDELRGVARGYNEQVGLKPLREREYWGGDPDFGRRTGLAYESLPAVDNSPATRMAYQAFEAETIAQYHALRDAGYVMEPWDPKKHDGKEQPYDTSEQMQADVRENKHLYFFTGGEPHPFLNRSHSEINGWTSNDIFRAVHDIMTHAQEGYQFGARGELNAAVKHSQMYSPIARRAMLTETHGQNSWTNYGPHNPQSLAAPDRPFADQKGALLPDDIVAEFEGRFLGETEAVASRKVREIAEALNLTPEQATVAGAVLEARARAWASAKPGRSAADYLRRFTFEQGGEPGLEALFQRYNQGLAGYRARTATNAFRQKTGPREDSRLGRRLARAAAREAKRDAGILPDPDTVAGRRKAQEILPDTDEIKWLKETAMREVFSDEGPGPYSAELDELTDLFYRAVVREQRRQLRATGELTDDVLFQVDTPLDNVEGGSTLDSVPAELSGRDRGTLEPLLDQPAPQELIDAGMADAAPIEWFKASDGTDLAIPGGLEGEFSFWDAWRWKAQQVDPNLIPTEIRVPLYEKLFRSQERSLTNPVDNWNRIAFAMMSPSLNLLSNEAAGAALRIRNLDDLARFANAPDTEAAYLALKAAGGTGKATGPQLRALQSNARRFIENPEWFNIRPGEDMLMYSERVMSVLDGMQMKIGNFGAMLSNPLEWGRGTADRHIVKLVAEAGLLPANLVSKLRDKKGQYLAPEPEIIPIKIRGKDNPNVPEHLRDLPWQRKDGKVMRYGGDYQTVHDAFIRYIKENYGDLPFAEGGQQWYAWDLIRGVSEPHTQVWPGIENLPMMDPADIRARVDATREAGYGRKAPSEPQNPADAVFWQEGQGQVKGATEFVADNEVVIRGLQSPDISTFVHEVGHVFRRDLDAEDLATAEGHYKVADGVWTREAEEAFARDFERWVRNNESTPPALQNIFGQLYEWMRQVYRSVLKRDVHPEMSQVFRNLFEDADPGTRGANLWTEPGTPGQILIDQSRVRETDHISLVKYGDDGQTAAVLNFFLDENGQAMPDTLRVLTRGPERGKGHATDLYAFAEQQGWAIEQASAASKNLTDEGRAFQKARWAKQQALEREQVQIKRDRARDLRREVREINKRADEIRTVRVDPSFLDENGNPTVTPESLTAIREQTAFVQDNFPHNYGIEKAPKVSWARYQPEDSHLAALLTERSNFAQVLFDYGPLSKVGQFVNWLTEPVQAARLAHDSRQQVFNKLMPLGAKSSEIGEFINVLRDQQSQGWTITSMQQPLFRGVTALPPNRIHRIARDVFGGNESFIRKFEEKYGSLDRMHVMLDEAHNSLIRKIDKRTLRGQKNGALARIFRSGYWAWQHLPGVRTASDATRMLSKVWYPVFRFQMDARWQALNVIEADIIAFMKEGIDGTRFSRRPDHIVNRNGQEVNLTQNATDFHGEQSGMPTVGSKIAGREGAYDDTGIFLTNQNLAPVIRRSFDIRRMESIENTINDLADTDPIIQTLRRKYGEERGTWAEQLDETLYNFDRQGVKRTVDEAVRRVGKDEGWSQAEYDQMVPLVQRLIDRNQQAFNDLTQIHVGNINRSRIERTLNSYWLYWPISYQIKATKWMAGVLTNRAFGSQTNLGGAWTLNRFAESMEARMQSESFAQEMEKNEDWWFVASMMLPITPWDMGVSLNRGVRYVGGNVLGLWPEYAGLENPADFAIKMAELGPIYTARLAGELFTPDEPRRESRGRSVTSIAP